MVYVIKVCDKVCTFFRDIHMYFPNWITEELSGQELKLF